jgi:hypothetical protein
MPTIRVHTNINGFAGRVEYKRPRGVSVTATTDDGWLMVRYSERDEMRMVAIFAPANWTFVEWVEDVEDDLEIPQKPE